jgi:hypothetical protein
MVTSRDLRPHADAADELLARWTPNPAQTAALTEWVTARPWRADPAQHTVNARLSTWAEACGAHWPEQLPREGETISRGQVFDVAATARQNQGWLPLLAAAYTWGYGTTGYGGRRFAQIAAREGVEDTLAQAVAALDADGAAAAYHRLRRAIKGLGPAFYTKFLYFAATSDTPGPAPVILDARVAASLREVTSGLTGAAGTPHAEDLATWLWRGPTWTTHRYEAYLDLADRATRHLHQVTGGVWPARADTFELALFDTDLRQSGVWAATS